MTVIIRKTENISGGGGEKVYRKYCRFFMDFGRDWQ